ncbi:MAG: hypothetical protein OHK0012_04620 [Synechococcales cyanobacterium]
MGEAEILQALQNNLAHFGVKAAAKVTGSSVQIVVASPPGQVVDYDALSRLIRVDLRALRGRNTTFSSLRGVLLVGRVEGDTQEKYRNISDLDASEAMDREGETISVSFEFDRGPASPTMAAPIPAPAPPPVTIDPDAQTLIAHPRRPLPAVPSSLPVPSAPHPVPAPRPQAALTPSAGFPIVPVIIGGVVVLVLILLVVFVF